MSQSKHVRVPVPVYEKAKEIQDEHDYPTLGEAIRHVFREAEYEV